MHIDDLPDLEFQSSDRLFGEARGNWRDVAIVVGLTSDSVPYTAAFKEAGDALVERAIGTRTNDLLLFPALYCYRHAVELVLKEIVYLWQRGQGCPVQVLRTHKLDQIWPAARHALEGAWPNGDRSQLDLMEAVIAELVGVDPDSEQFRYEHDRSGHVRHLPEELIRVDLRRLAYVMNKLLSTLAGAVDGISDLVAAAE